jgi:2-polyprenyl-6-hydroxyphenyl methylase/3-demethylubiquinone-9 3-methyltransferase
MNSTADQDGAHTVFDFGRNWRSFVGGGIEDWRVELAAASLRKALVVADLRGRSFLDVGCGSGLFSVAAVALGARRVVSFDSDAGCVAIAGELRDRRGVDAAVWQIRQGSILDPAFLATLEPADAVYAWGVLHHTGAMWRAIDNAAAMVAPGGKLVLAIYNEVTGPIGSSAQWWWIKRLYNRAPTALRRCLEYAFIAQRAARDLVVLRNPMARFRSHARPRGMDYRHDVRDWIGGFPYEYAKPDAVIGHACGKLGLELVWRETTRGHVCNELTFRRPAERVER